MPIVPGSKVLVKSIITDKFCRVVEAGSQQQILCDVDAEQATPMDYTGSGFAYQVSWHAHRYTGLSTVCHASCMVERRVSCGWLR